MESWGKEKKLRMKMKMKRRVFVDSELRMKLTDHRMSI